MENLLKELKVLLPAEKFIVSGSVALAKYGLFNPAKIGDIDILLVKPTKEAVELALLLQKEYPPKKGGSGGKRIASFMKDGKIVEVFDTPMRDSLCIEGIDYSRICDIISAKKQYNRLKDWVQLRTISRLFFKEEEFNAFLNK